MTTPKRPGRRQLVTIQGSKPKSADGHGQDSGSYGKGVRAQVFEVIVRQALAGAPWQEICAGPMSVNNITPQEIMDEIDRRSPPTQPAAAAGVPRPPVFKDYTRNRRDR